MTEFDTMVSYLGKQVRVRLTNDYDKNQVHYEGTLLAIEQTGQCVLRMDDGFSAYCWPALEMELLDA